MLFQKTERTDAPVHLLFYRFPGRRRQAVSLERWRTFAERVAQVGPGKSCLRLVLRTLNGRPVEMQLQSGLAFTTTRGEKVTLPHHKSRVGTALRSCIRFRRFVLGVSVFGLSNAGLGIFSRFLAANSSCASGFCLGYSWRGPSVRR